MSNLKKAIKDWLTDALRKVIKESDHQEIYKTIVSCYRKGEREGFKKGYDKAHDEIYGRKNKDLDDAECIVWTRDLNENLVPKKSR